MFQKRSDPKCPHPDCKARIPVPRDTPAGFYQCPCSACWIRLLWGPKNRRMLTQIDCSEVIDLFSRFPAKLKGGENG